MNAQKTAAVQVLFNTHLFYSIPIVGELNTSIGKNYLHSISGQKLLIKMPQVFISSEHSLISPTNVGPSF
jgi:hypothetical protein